MVLPHMQPTKLSDTARRPPVRRVARATGALLVNALFAAALAVSCGSPAEEETFKGTRAALAEKLGNACALVPVPNSSTREGETYIEEQHEECEPGYCVVQVTEPGETEGICSCRCDGPEGTGPFCACSAGFVCELLVQDLGFDDWPGDNLSGSYCMPE